MAGVSGTRRRRRREETEPRRPAFLASTFGEKLCKHGLIQTYSRERVPRPCTAASC